VADDVLDDDPHRPGEPRKVRAQRRRQVDEAAGLTVQRDIPAAKKLLAEAGYGGRPIKMITNKRYQPMFDQAILAQAMAQEAGLNIELEVIDWAIQQDRYLAGNYQIMSHGFSAGLDPSLSFEMFSGDKTK
jgi:peptide/nickel transport system substrate-binding protein